jgi:multiple sugar transport system permease protein
MVVRSSPVDRPGAGAAGWLTQRRREAIEGYLLASPWFVGLALFTVVPVFLSVYYSFTDYEIIRSPAFVGLKNYTKLFSTDRQFWTSLGNTAYMVLAGVPFHMLAGLSIALLLNQRVRGLAFYRTFFFLPSQVSGVALAYLWGWMLHPQFGLTSIVLKLSGVQPPNFLQDPNWVKPAFVVLGTWGVGTTMIIWLAGLQGIPDVFYEAAQVDGASRLRQFFSITLPLLTPTIFFVLVTGVIGTFQIFTQAYVITNGGPNDATLFYALLIYRHAFQYFNMGYAAALAWVLFMIVMALTLLNLKLGGRWVYYEAERGRDE